MPLILIMRHAHAEPPGTGPDSERNLTPQGRTQALKVARLLAYKPSIILSSPYKRALQTAEIIAGEKSAQVKTAHELEPGRASLESLASLNPPDGALVVGHNPSLERIIYSLTGCGVRLAPASLAVVSYGHRLAPGTGMLLSLLNPEFLLAPEESRAGSK